MAGDPATARKRMLRWKLRLTLAKRLLRHTFPEDDEFLGSTWDDWGRRIREGHDADDARIRTIIERFASTDSATDVGDWIAEDMHNMEHVTNSMYAALVVSAWCKMEAFFKLLIKIVNGALNRAGEAPYQFDRIKEFFDKNVGLNLETIAEYPTVNAIRILNNSYKHSDGQYKPDASKPHTRIDQTLLDRWKILDNQNQIDFSKTPIEEFISCCAVFCRKVLSATEAKVATCGGDKGG